MFSVFPYHLSIFQVNPRWEQQLFCNQGDEQTQTPDETFLQSAVSPSIQIQRLHPRASWQPRPANVDQSASAGTDMLITAPSQSQRVSIIIHRWVIYRLHGECQPAFFKAAPDSSPPGLFWVSTSTGSLKMSQDVEATGRRLPSPKKFFYGRVVHMNQCFGAEYDQLWNQVQRDDTRRCHRYVYISCTDDVIAPPTATNPAHNNNFDFIIISSPEHFWIHCFILNRYVKIIISRDEDGQ